LIPARRGVLARTILLFTARDDSQRIVRKRSLQFDVGPVANDRSHLVGEDPWEQRQITRPIIARAEPVAIAA
jgi:hypothetical protein